MAQQEVSSQGDLDLAAVAEAVARPGIDTRQWVSIGLVEQQTNDQPDQIIEFDPELGPLVQVTLQPSGMNVTARVMGSVAGKLEAEYNPFVAGDEVVVVVPEGDERAGCVIIGRLNNGLDLWPGAVAGQNSSSNTFAFKRQQAPYIFEFGASCMFRSSGTGSLLSFDQTGNVTLSDANSAFLSFSSDAITLQSGDTNEMIQFDLHQSIVMIQGGLTSGGILQIGDKSSFFSAGPFSFNVLGNPGIEHAASTEGVVNMLAQLLPAVWALVGPALQAIPVAPTFPGGAPFVAALTPLFTPGSVTAMVTAMLGAAGVSSIASVAQAISTAILAKKGDPSGNSPGVGSQGLLIG